MMLDSGYLVETAGQYFSQENPVIREITERVQAMYAEVISCF